MSNAANTSSNLTAEFDSRDGWRVIDSAGGIWWPSEEAAAEIEESSDPAALAVSICDARPMRGTWAA